MYRSSIYISCIYLNIRCEYFLKSSPAKQQSPLIIAYKVKTENLQVLPENWSLLGWVVGGVILYSGKYGTI